jgi:DNA-binding MurR/RpiR family transcriptional regulator
MIAKAVLGDPHAIVLASMSEIADMSGTSEAAVSRLARRLGFSGFPEFRVALAQDLVVSPEDMHENIEVGDDAETIIRKTTTSNIRALRDTQAILDATAVEAAIGLLWEAGRTAFFGVGGSAIVARDAHHKFLRTGRAILQLTDTHEQAMFAALCTGDDLLVIISHSGATAELVDTARTAKERGARIIAITHFGRPPLARLADVHLGTSSRETRYRPEALSSRIAALNILDVLYLGVALRMDRQMETNLAAIRTAVARKRR